MTGSVFDDIRPYNDQEIVPVLRKLAGNRVLIRGIRKQLLPQIPETFGKWFEFFIRAYLWKKLRSIQTVEQFQRRITSDVVLDRLIARTTDGLTFTGLENVPKDEPYILVSNHRDIVLDAALEVYVVGNNDRGIPAIGFGDNLIINELVTDLIRINNAFIIKRRTPLNERDAVTLQLSEYIWSLHQQGTSVWIAQNKGRAKEGDDRTSPSLIKMLHMSQKEGGLNLTDFVREVNIVPTATSFEKDPCDRLKAKEVLRKIQVDVEAKQMEDLWSIKKGLMGRKGRVHVAFGKPLRGEYGDVDEVVRDIDDAIHLLYKLWPTNYIAYDELAGSREYAAEYLPEERESFLARFARENAEIRRMALAMYAKPVINRRALEDGRGWDAGNR